METETKPAAKVKKRIVVKKKVVKKIVTPEGSPTKSNLSQTVPVPVPVSTKPKPKPKSRVELVDDYLRDMSDLERKTMEIARSHLGSSFNLDKSVGFLEWLSSREEG
tara:strand:- start:1075 stop:1395 length:321 start_codon:yes stop_codon:yes gene_type:complete